MPRRTVLLCLLLVVGCAKPPADTSEAKRLREEADAFKADSARVRAEYAKLEAANKDLRSQLDQARGRPKQQPQSAPKPALLGISILSPVNGRPPDDKIVNFGESMIDVGKVGHFDDAGLGLEIVEILNEQYMRVRFQRKRQLTFVVYHPTAGLVTGKIVEVPGIWKVVGTCKPIATTYYLMHYVAAK